MAAESAKKLHVAVVTPEGELWSGESDMVIAKTVEGDIGIMPGHVPVLATLTPDCVLRILGARESGEVVAAIHGGFLSMEEDRLSVLAEVAELAESIDVTRAQAALDRSREGDDEEARRRAARARGRLRAAGADTA